MCLSGTKFTVTAVQPVSLLLCHKVQEGLVISVLSHTREHCLPSGELDREQVARGVPQ